LHGAALQPHRGYGSCPLVKVVHGVVDILRIPREIRANSYVFSRNNVGMKVSVAVFPRISLGQATVAT